MTSSRVGTAAAAISVVVFAAATAEASDDRGPPPPAPDPAAAFVVGAVTQTAGLVIGGSMVASGEGFGPTPKTGFLVMQSGFVLTPVFAHAVVGEWTRGLWFAIVPTAALGGTIALFSVAPGAVTDQDLGEVRVLWSMVTAGMLSSTVGVIDATLVRSRTVHVLPSPVGGVAGGPGSIGCSISGVF